MFYITFAGPIAEAALAASPEAATAAAKPTDALACHVTLNGKQYAGELPLLPRRALLVHANYLNDQDPEAAAHWYKANCILAATIGLCWRGPDLGVGHLVRDYGADVLVYGEAVLTVFMSEYDVKLDELNELTFECHRLMAVIQVSRITQEQLDKEREDFTAGRPDPSEPAANETETPEPSEEGWAVPNSTPRM